MNWGNRKIIDVMNELASQGYTGASTGEQIAAAFVLNRMEFLPSGYSVIEAWDYLGPKWQGHVRLIRQEYLHEIVHR